MGVQVGSLCFATAADAAPHACAAFVPVSTVAGGQLITVGCSSANADGSLSMYRAVADTSGAGSPVVTAFTQQVEEPPCVHSDYLDALEGIAGPFLACLVACWGLYKVASYLGWGRADSS